MVALRKRKIETSQSTDSKVVKQEKKRSKKGTESSKRTLNSEEGGSHKAKSTDEVGHSAEEVVQRIRSMEKEVKASKQHSNNVVLILDLTVICWLTVVSGSAYGSTLDTLILIDF